MDRTDLYYFNILKKKLEQTFLATNNVFTPMKNWKGSEIVAFQEDLWDKVKAKVSEKWFYTYIKNVPNKLPRIDILNFLSVYVGFESWKLFIQNHSEIIKSQSTKKNIKKSVLVMLLLVFSLILIQLVNYKNIFQFCFFDEDKKEPIHSCLNIKILHPNQTPTFLKTDSLGCFTYQTTKKEIQFIVQSPFYKTDTIIRNNKSNLNTSINLQTDDYALVLQYYINGNTIDWKKRKKELISLIADDAQIYQLYNNSISIEIYSKNDFISKMTTPTSSLKNIEILDKTFVNGKISKLKFRIK